MPPLRRVSSAVVLVVVELVLAVNRLPADDSSAKHALLIGVTTYEKSQLNVPQLQFPEADATAIRSLLAGAGYEVVTLLGRKATRANIREALSRLEGQGNQEGVVLVGLFGHGVQYGEDAYFCPYDAQIRKVLDAQGRELRDRDGQLKFEPDPASLVDMKSILDALTACGAGNRVLLADCCREDPSAARGRAFGSSLKESDLPPGTAALFACSRDEQAFEHQDWGHGAFTRALLDRVPQLAARDDTTANALSSDAFKAVNALLRDKTAGRSHQTVHSIIKGVVDLQLNSTLLGATAGEVRDFTDLGIRFCWCLPGTFTMGALDDYTKYADEDERPVTVEISTGYWFGQGELSQQQWKQVMGRTLRQQYNHHKARESGLAELDSPEGADYAITFVTYSESGEFCRKLTDRERAAGRLKNDWVFRLPTEAEWEYACRAESSTEFWWGARLADQPDGFTRTMVPDYPDRKKILDYRRNNWNIGGLIPNPDEWVLDAYSRRLPGGVDPVNWRGSEGVLRGMRSSCNRVEWRREELGGMGSGIGFRLVLGRPVVE